MPRSGPDSDEVRPGAGGPLVGENPTKPSAATAQRFKADVLTAGVDRRLTAMSRSVWEFQVVDGANEGMLS